MCKSKVFFISLKIQIMRAGKGRQFEFHFGATFGPFLQFWAPAQWVWPSSEGNKHYFISLANLPLQSERSGIKFHQYKYSISVLCLFQGCQVAFWLKIQPKVAECETQWLLGVNSSPLFRKGAETGRSNQSRLLCVALKWPSETWFSRKHQKVTEKGLN